MRTCKIMAAGVLAVVLAGVSAGALAQRNVPAPAKKEAAKEEPAKKKPAAKPQPAKKADAKKAEPKKAEAKKAEPKKAEPAAEAKAEPKALPVAADAGAKADPAPAAETAAEEATTAAEPAAGDEEVKPAPKADWSGGETIIPMPASKVTGQEIEAGIRACTARKPPRKTKSALTEGTFRQIERIQTAIGKGEYAESEKKLNELAERAHGDYEKAVVWQTLAFIYAQQEKTDKAIALFRKVLDTNALPQNAHEQIMFNIGQLLIADGKTDAGLRQIEAYMKESCNPLPDAHVMLAISYAEKKRFRDALEQIDIGLVKAKTPKESWLQAKLAMHYELKEFAACAGVLLQLVSVAPTKEQYWKQMSSLYFELGKDPQALAILALADRKGFINEESEFKNLANLYFYLQIPYKAGQVIQRGLDEGALKADEKNLELLANAWLLARENKKAEAALKKAAAASEKGELYKRLAHLYVEEENWKAAIEALDNAKAKGGIENKGEFAMLTGVTAMQLNDYARAEAAFRDALGHEKTRKAAGDWLNHLTNLKQEQEAAAALAEAKKHAAAEDAETGQN
ncbi:MAG: hypothetical protein HYV18_06065 [Gammaproteobacteria bacterium]|nr:hypothetical protein [Gammaproteobacteria bacterium]